MKARTIWKMGWVSVIICGSMLITLDVIVYGFMLPQNNPPVKEQKLAQDTIKVDTLPLKVQQMIYMKQMVQQQNKMDSLIKAKKKKK